MLCLIKIRFVCKNNINTEQELIDYQKLAYEKINPLKSERERLEKIKKFEIHQKLTEERKQFTKEQEKKKYRTR